MTSHKPSLAATRRSLILGVLALGALAIGFLWKPIATIGTRLYTSADISQVFPLTRIEAEHFPANEILSDPVTEMQPWLMFNRAELRQGRLPLINPWNGGGVPHLANAQSAVFSPFSLPFYVLPFHAALIASALLKLLTAGVFTLLFLRALGLGGLAALAGAVIFAFCGHNLLLLGYPHAGAAALLPAALYFVERVLARHERGAGLDRWGLVGLALSLAAVGLVGQPEPLFFAGVLTAAYAVLRIGRRIWTAHDKGHELRVIRPLCFSLAGVAAIAFALCAVQILPFIEYMNGCRLLEQRTGTQTPLLAPIWPLHAFPELFGNPSKDTYLGPDYPPSTFETANLGYVGSVAILLALISFVALMRARRNAIHALFAGTLVLWIVWAYDLFHLNQYLIHVPVLGVAPINRSHFLFTLCASICAAFAVEELARPESRRRWGLACGVAATGIVSYAVFRISAEHLVDRMLSYVAVMDHKPRLPSADIAAAAARHIAAMTPVFAVGCLCAATLPLLDAVWWRRALGVCVIACVFAQTGFLLRAYNPTIEEKYFFPRTPVMRALQESVGHEPLAIVGPTILPPSMNMPYGITLLANYDGLWVARYDSLYRASFGEGTNWRPMEQATERALELFGARWVLTSGDWPPIDTLFPSIVVNPATFVTVGEILPQHDVVQTFTSPYESLSGLRLSFDTYGRRNDCLLALRLSDATTGELIAERAVRGLELAPGADGRADVVFSFPRVERSRGRVFGLRVEAQDAAPGRALGLVRRTDYDDWQNQALWRADRRWRRESLDAPLVRMGQPGWKHPDLEHWRLTHDGQALAGGLVMDLAFDRALRTRVRAIGPFDLWELPKDARYRVVSHAIGVKTRQEARGWLEYPDFDPRRAATIESLDAEVARTSLARREEVSAVEIVDESPVRVVLRVNREQPGWLVTNKPWIPGWKAHVNSASVPILCANEAFVAVAVGEGQNEVELVYDPWTVDLGLWLGAFGVLGLIVLARVRTAAAVV